MSVSLRVDATLGFVASGLWLGQVVTAAALLLVVVLGDPAAAARSGPQSHAMAVLLFGGTLVACVALRVLVSALLLVTRGIRRTTVTPTSLGLRLAEALVACTAIGLVGLVTLEVAVSGTLEGLVLAVGASQFGTLVFVLAVLVVVHAAGSTVFGTVRRAE